MEVTVGSPPSPSNLYLSPSPSAVFSFGFNSLVGLVDKASVSRAADLSSIPAFRFGIFSGSSHVSELKMGTPVATLPARGLRLALGLFDPVSVYCDWVR